MLLKALLSGQGAEERAAQVNAQLIEARKAWDAERAALQGRLAETEEQRNAMTAHEAQASNRVNTLQLQLQTAEGAKGGAQNAAPIGLSPFHIVCLPLCLYLGALVFYTWGSAGNSLNNFS